MLAFLWDQPTSNVSFQFIFPPWMGEIVNPQDLEELLESGQEDETLKK